MGATDFQVVCKALAQCRLSAEEVAYLRDLLASSGNPNQCLGLIEQAAGRPPCPDCGGHRCHRCGQASGLQRYRCVTCRRSFNALTGTPLAYLRLLHKWLPFLQQLIESKTVRAAAREVAVAKSTSFRWRHRFIAAVRREKRPPLSGIVEADETYHLESQKGSRHLNRPPRKRGGTATRPGVSAEFDCILVARDRTRHTYEFITGRGPVTARQLTRHLLPVLAPDVLLISDAAKAYGAFARSAGITHEMVNVRAGIRARGAFHIQGVNGWHSRFKNWLRRFHGVASRYLASYTGWQRVLDAAALPCPRIGSGSRSRQGRNPVGSHDICWPNKFRACRNAYSARTLPQARRCASGPYITAYVYEGGAFANLATDGYPGTDVVDLNNSGQLLGYAAHARLGGDYFLYENDKTAVLNDLLAQQESGAGWLVGTAYDINDKRRNPRRRVQV